MTKNKTRKMTKSTFAIIIMGIAMVAMLAFGGTFAYFTATAKEVSGSATTGIVKLGSGEITNLTNAKVVTGDTIAEGVKLVNSSDVDTYAVIAFTVSFDNSNVTTGILNYQLAQSAAVGTEGQEGYVAPQDLWEEQELQYHVEAVGTEGQEGYVAAHDVTVTYLVRKLAAISSSDEDVDVCGAITFAGSSRGTEGSTAGVFTYDNDYMGKTVTITMSAWAVQARNIANVTGDADTPAEWAAVVSAATGVTHNVPVAQP